MDINKYNTRVRQAMSEQYVSVSKEKTKLENELYAISMQLADPNVKANISYLDYMNLKAKEERMQIKVARLKIEREIWDKARDICIEIADEEE